MQHSVGMVDIQPGAGKTTAALVNGRGLHGRGTRKLALDPAQRSAPDGCYDAAREHDLPARPVASSRASTRCLGAWGQR